MWFTPGLYCFLSIGMTLFLFYIDQNIISNAELPSFLYQGGWEKSAPFFTTLLSSMITMATLAISVTIITISFAASQMGPRLIKTFMADQTTKNYIGIFFMVVVSCLVLNVIIYKRYMGLVFPNLTANYVIFLCFTNLFALLGFVHHVAYSCIADNVVLKLYHLSKRKLTRALMVYHEREDYKIATEVDIKDIKRFNGETVAMPLQEDGYLQSIDWLGLIHVCVKYDILIELAVKPGDYIINKAAYVKITFYDNRFKHIPEELKNAILGKIYIGTERTPTQDIEYAIRHLVEISLRALSSGINDSYTAVNVINRLTSIMQVIITKNENQKYLYDEHNILRIQTDPHTINNIIFNAFNQIRSSAENMPFVLSAIINNFENLLALNPCNDAKDELKKQMQAIDVNLDNMDQKTYEVSILKNKIADITRRL